jgi:hypothetical protein
MIDNKIRQQRFHSENVEFEAGQVAPMTEMKLLYRRGP